MNLQKKLGVKKPIKTRSVDPATIKSTNYPQRTNSNTKSITSAPIAKKTLNDGFVNPYNFIQLPDKKAQAYEADIKDRHTGYIEYTITTKTPIFIPNSSSDSAFEETKKNADHKSYDFYSYTQLDKDEKYENKYHVPVIPGSEMRGVVRNVYETLTDSCMSSLNEDEYPVKRSGVAFKPGLLKKENDKYVLYKATSVLAGRTDNKKFPPKGFENKHNGDSYKGGYLIKWGMGVEKRHYHSYTLNTDSNGRPQYVENDLEKDELKRMIFPLLKSYLEQSKISPVNKKAYEEYQCDLENFLEERGGEYFPINYSKEGGLFYIAPAIFSKEVAENSIGRLSGEFSPCRDNYCSACALFGYVTKNSAGSTKIRFSDLDVTDKMESKNYYDKNKITIEALIGSKLSNVDFYLEQPEGASFWTYDYYIKNEKLYKYEGNLRGRKYYWHHSNFTYHPADVSKFNKTIRPVKSGISFSGKVYYECISKKQLSQLIWILNSGKEGLGLKIGAAKPFGYGSIECYVNAVQERNITLVDGVVKYKWDSIKFEDVTYEAAGLSQSGKIKDEFYKIANFSSIPQDTQITYPRTLSQKNDVEMKEGFQWFVNNRSSLTNDRAKARIIYTLPHILDEDIRLPYN